jgi:hypothetical protein
MGESQNTDDVSQPRESGWRVPVTWLGLLAAGGAVWELTRNPALGTAVVCLKFAIEDIRTANWLRRHDLLRGRGLACWWLYVAFGLWKAAGVGLLTAMVVTAGFAFLQGGQPGNGLNQAILGALVVFGVSLGLAFVVAAIAVEVARRGGVRLWLDGTASRVRRLGEWPPQGTGPARNNHVTVLLLTAGLAPLIAVLALILAVTDGRLPGLGVPMLVASVTFPIAILFFLRYRPVLASSPDDCWSPCQETEDGAS